MKLSAGELPREGRRSASAAERLARRGARAVMAAAAAGSAAMLAGCSGGVLDPQGPVGAEEKRLILTAAGLMLIVVVPVIVMTVAFAIRYRASNTRARYSPEWSHSRGLEIVVWLVPCLIVTALGYLAWTRAHSLDPFQPLAARTPAGTTARTTGAGVGTAARVAARPASDPISIQVISLDWKWLFIYPDEGVASVNEVAFPVNTAVDFSVTSDTVMNSFFIPQLGSQIYSMAGMRTQVHLLASRPGRYQGLSANFSGDGFSRMRFTARALSPADYEAWLRAVHGSSEKLDWASYGRLAMPSEAAPVEYFSSVQTGLFDGVIGRYAGGRAGAMQMSRRP